MSIDLTELERTHERRTRRLSAADRRAPGPLVGSASFYAEAELVSAATAIEMPTSFVTLAELGPNARYTVTNAPGFLIKVIRNTLFLVGSPMTAYEIAHRIVRSHPTRWEPVSIRHKVGMRQTGLFTWDLNGLSDNNNPCTRYWLTPPPAEAS